MRNGLRYWGNVALIAGGNACSAIGWNNWGHGVTTGAIALMMALLTYLVVSDRELADSIMYPALLGVASIILIFVGAFMVQISPPD